MCKFSITKCNYNDHVKEDKMGRVCRTHREVVECRILVEKPGEWDHQEDLDISGRIILRLILEK
jgi:hypothetical protein